MLHRDKEKNACLRDKSAGLARYALDAEAMRARRPRASEAAWPPGVAVTQSTLAIAAATAPMFCVFSAATQMRPESMP